MGLRRLVTACCIVTLLGGQAVAQVSPAPVVAEKDQAVSNGQNARVRIVRHPRKSDDPLTKYGAGFFVVVFNKSNEPLSVTPDMITIRDKSGTQKFLMTPERLAQLKQQEADNAAAIGTAISMLGMFGGGMAAMRQNPAAASQTLAATQATSLALLTATQSNAAAIASEQDALAAGYAATPFPSASVPPLTAMSGRIIVDGLKDKDPAVIQVNVAGETHEFNFGRAGE